MNLVKRAAQQAGAGLSLADFDKMLDQAYGGQPSYTGKQVSQSTALAVAAVWACVNAIADDVATLPLMTYRRIKSGRERAMDHYLWDLMILQANPELNAWRFFQLMQAWVLLWGNAYAEIEMNLRGQVVALWPWRPDRVKVKRYANGGQLFYEYRLQAGEQPIRVPAERIFHLRGFGLDGVSGLSPIDCHRQTVGLSMAITEHGARFFSNGARPLGVLSTENELSDKAWERVKKSWEESHQGLDNAHRVAILEQGLKWQESGANMVDAAYIQSQNLTQEDIARIYKVPQHRIGLLGKSTNNNIEEQSLEYILYTLAPWAANWQNQVHSDLLSTRENRSIYTAFNFTNLLRGNHEAMGKFISVMRQWGILNADEIREDYLDKNPLPGGIGKTYWEPVNMMPAQKPGDSPETNGIKKISPPPEDDDAGEKNKGAGKTNGLAH